MFGLRLKRLAATIALTASLLLGAGAALADAPETPPSPEQHFSLSLPDFNLAAFLVDAHSAFTQEVADRLARQAVAEAISDKYEGLPYTWGGKLAYQTEGLDCSGFTQAVILRTLGIDIGQGTIHQQAGVIINPENTNLYAHTGNVIYDPLDTDTLRPGMLLFFGMNEPKDSNFVQHVVMVVSNYNGKPMIVDFSPSSGGNDGHAIRPLPERYKEHYSFAVNHFTPELVDQLMAWDLLDAQKVSELFSPPHSRRGDVTFAARYLNDGNGNPLLPPRR